LQPQADALARIKNDVQGELSSMLNTDDRVRRLRADLESLKKEERTMTVLERMKEILLQLKTLQHAYQVN
jgi:AmiR/NasT family two-component response regulator